MSLLAEDFKRKLGIQDKGEGTSQREVNLENFGKSVVIEGCYCQTARPRNRKMRLNKEKLC